MTFRSPRKCRQTGSMSTFEPHLLSLRIQYQIESPTLRLGDQLAMTLHILGVDYKAGGASLACRDEIQHLTMVVVPYPYEQGQRSRNQAGIVWSGQVDDVRFHFCLLPAYIDIIIAF